jgi:hypothetical protein
MEDFALPVLQGCGKTWLDMHSLRCLGYAFFALRFGSDCNSLGFLYYEVDFLFVFAASVFFRHLFKSSHMITHCLNLLVFHLFGVWGL